MRNEALFSVEEIEIFLSEAFADAYSLQFMLVADRNLFLVVDRSGEKFVLKVTDSDLTDVERLESLQSFDIKGLERTMEYCEYRGCFCIIKEYVHGRTLYETVDEDGPVDQLLAVDWMRQLATTLSALHSPEHHIVYRDIHPKNIIINEENEPILIDSDSVRCFRDGQNQDTIRIGTIGFIAPEQYGFTQSDQRSDIYSLGMVFYYLLSGRMPGFNHNGISFDGVSAEGSIKKILQKMTDFTPDRRYRHMRLVIRDLLKAKNEIERSRRTIVYHLAMVVLMGLTVTWLMKGMVLGGKEIEAAPLNGVAASGSSETGVWETLETDMKMDSGSVVFGELRCRREGLDLFLRIDFSAAAESSGYAVCMTEGDSVRTYLDQCTVEGENQLVLTVFGWFGDEGRGGELRFVPVIGNEAYVATVLPDNALEQ